MIKRKAFLEIFTSIKRCSLFIAGGVFVYACSEQPSAVSSETNTQVSSKVEQKVYNELEPLTEKTAVSFFQELTTKKQTNTFRIETKFGDIELELFEDTPLHKSNFNYLVDQKYFDDTWFYRVSKDHVIQAGNTDDQQTVRRREKIGDYRLPAEKLNAHLHTYGAVAAARSYKQNKDKRSDPFEFYIVLGKKYTAAQLKQMVTIYGFDLTEAKIKAYAEQGGAPHLDGEHTVFGRVIKGMDVVEQISEQETDEGEWPLLNIPIKVSPIQD